MRKDLFQGTQRRTDAILQSWSVLYSQISSKTLCFDVHTALTCAWDARSSPNRTARGARSERAVKVKDQTATNNSGDLEESSQACSLQRAVKTAKGQERDRGESIHTCGPAWEPQTADYEKPVNRALLHFCQIHRTRFGTSLHADSNLICVDPESYGIPGCVLKVCAEQFACVFIFHTSRLPSVVLLNQIY